MGEVNKKSTQRNTHCLKEVSSKFITSQKPRSTVDLKIAEQLEEFDSQHSAKKQEVVEKAPRPCSVAIMPVLPPVFGAAGTFDKHFESLRSPSLEDVQESAEELDSPKKSIKSEDVSGKTPGYPTTNGGVTSRDAGEEPTGGEEGKTGDKKEGMTVGEEKMTGEEEKMYEAAKKDTSVVESKQCGCHIKSLLIN